DGVGNGPFVRINRLDRFAGSGIPQADGTVYAGRQNSVTVRREHGAADGIGVPLEDVQFSTRLNVPQADRVIPTCRQGLGTIGRERHTLYRVMVADKLSAGQVEGGSAQKGAIRLRRVDQLQGADTEQRRQFAVAVRSLHDRVGFGSQSLAFG